MTYIGRFAPSPTGSLHFGSLFAAVVSYLDAKAKQGTWLVRIDDIDKPREVAGSSASILNALQTHGLIWDGAVSYQSQSGANYQTALKQLQQLNLCYYCDCSRSRTNGHAYDGRCRNQHCGPQANHAIRIKSAQHDIQFSDYWQGRISENIANTHGDFIIWRKDGICAYQLAVVVDDHSMAVNHVIRGNDLIDSTARQLQLYQALNLPVPQYGHFPVLLNEDGQKLSKQSYASAIETQNASTNLRAVLKALRQTEAPLSAQTSTDILTFASDHWTPEALPKHNIVWSN